MSLSLDLLQIFRATPLVRRAVGSRLGLLAVSIDVLFQMYCTQYVGGTGEAS